MIFSDRLKTYVSKDTLLHLMPGYKQTVDDYLNTHEAEQAFIQNARYNYSSHLRAREDAEQQLRLLKEKLWIGIGGLIIILLAILSIVIWRKYHKSLKVSQIMEGVILTDKLKEESTVSCSEGNEETSRNEEDKLLPKSTEVFDTKQRILDEIQSYRDNNPYDSIDDKIKSSPLYKDLKEKAENRRVMGKDVTWREIEELIEVVSPGFDRRLTILTQAKITHAERHVAYFMKFGFTQSQMAILLAKEPSTISAQRTSLARKIGYDKSAIAVIIVRL